MNPIDFVKKYVNDARESDKSTGINYLVSLAQAALESGWGEKAPMNNFFGIKDTDRVNCQLIPTTEINYSANKTAQQVGLSVIDHIEPKQDEHGKTYFIYHGKAWFETFETPKDAFIAHGKLFFNKWPNGRYVYDEGLKHLHEPEVFVDAIASTYASGLNYAKLVKSIMKSIQNIIDDYKL